MWEGCPPSGSGPPSLTGSSIIVMRAPRPPKGEHSCGAGAEAAEGGRREQGGRRAACLGLAVCVCVCLRACVCACRRVYREAACSPMEAGPGAGRLQRRTPPRQLRGPTGPGRGWLQGGGQMARRRLRGPLSARPRGPPTRPWGTSSWPSSSSSCRCNSCSSSTCSTCRDRGWSACSPAKPRGPCRPSHKVSAQPPPSPSPTALACPRGLQGASCSRGPPVFLGPHQPPLSAPQQLCAPRTCPSCGRARVPPGSPPRTASSRRGWTSPARPPPLPRSPPPPKSHPPSPTTPCPTDSPLCSHLGETGMELGPGGGTADLPGGWP